MELSLVPTGMTVGAHRIVIELLLRINGPAHSPRILDIPCGNTDLVGSLHRFLPQAEVRGCNLARPPSLDEDDFAVVDVSRPFRVFSERAFDCIVSVSGIMEFDNNHMFHPFRCYCC